MVSNETTITSDISKRIQTYDRAIKNLLWYYVTDNLRNNCGAERHYRSQQSTFLFGQRRNDLVRLDEMRKAEIHYNCSLQTSNNCT